MTKKEKNIKLSKIKKLFILGIVLIILGVTTLGIGIYLDINTKKSEDSVMDYDKVFDREVNDKFKKEICHNNLCIKDVTLTKIGEEESMNMVIISGTIINKGKEIKDKTLKVTVKTKSKTEVFELENINLKSNEEIPLEIQTTDLSLVKATSFDFE